MDLEKLVRETMEYHHMTEKGGHIIAAVSGGADSACLLHVLKALAGPDTFTLEAFHMNHCLRGGEADRDEAFTGELCRRLEIPLTVAVRDVRACSRERGISEEEAGRLLRYEELRELVEKRTRERGEGAPRCTAATAHHRDDSAETILYNLFRGTGLKGLGGISPVSEGLIRPLIRADRGAIEDWMREKGHSWCEDSTNRQDCYARNRIRLRILPLAEEINREAPANIVRAGGFISQADRYLEEQAAKLCGRHCFREGAAVGISPEVLKREPEILQAYVIRRMLRMAGCPMKDLGAVHVEAAAALAGGRTGKRTDLPGGYRAWNGYGALFVGPGREAEEKRLPELRFSVFPREKGMEIPKNQYTKWFDYDKMKGVPFLRFRRTGDYFMLPGGGKKSLKAYMIDEKIPREMRDRIPVLAEEDHVLWIIGYRISEYYKVTAQTKHILEVTADGGEK